jgi:hypothetical protein
MNLKSIIGNYMKLAAVLLLFLTKRPDLYPAVVYMGSAKNAVELGQFPVMKFEAEILA